MSVTMTPVLQKFLDSCQGIPEIINVTVEDPTDLMMAQVAGAFELSQLPVLFRFTIKDSEGNPQPVEGIIPYEILNTLNAPPVSELVNAADRHSIVPAYGIRFTHPDGTGSYPLVGHEWVSADIPEIEELIARIKALPNVIDVTVHNVVDPEIIAKTGYDNAVRFVISVKGVTDLHITEKNDYFHDYSNFVLSKEIYLNKENYDNIVANAAASIETILAKGKLC